jgi:DNA repair protein RadC
MNCKDYEILTSRQAYNLLKPYARKRQEHFLALTLSTAHRVIKRHVITIGLLNKTSVHPREVFYKAIVDNAAAIIVAHNHPSGVKMPSMDDNELTERLNMSSEIMGIQLVDHLIITERGYYSYREENQLTSYYSTPELDQFCRDYRNF